MTQCLCGTYEVDLVGSKDDREVGRCKACGLLRTLNPPDNYHQLYTDGEAYHAERIGHIPYQERLAHDMTVAETRWPKLLRQYRVLDVGCANGGFIAWCHSQGMMVAGLEPNAHMARWVTDNVKLRVYTSWPEVVGHFDIITYHDVLEHVVDPLAELLEAKQRLYMGGLLVIDTPDEEAFGEDPMQSHHMKPREHLWFFTERHLLALLDTLGFDPVDLDRPIPGKVVVYARKWQE